MEESLTAIKRFILWGSLICANFFIDDSSVCAFRWIVISDELVSKWIFWPSSKFGFFFFPFKIGSKNFVFTLVGEEFELTLAPFSGTAAMALTYMVSHNYMFIHVVPCRESLFRVHPKVKPKWGFLKFVSVRVRSSFCGRTSVWPISFSLSIFLSFCLSLF